jgi:hypothetical protein
MAGTIGGPCWKNEVKLPLDGVALLGHEYDAHPAFADLLQQLVWPDDGPRAFRNRRIQHRMLLGIPAIFQEAPRLLVRCQQAFHLRPQYSVRPAHFVQIRVAKLAWHFFERIQVNLIRFGIPFGHTCLDRP